jgi:hypothetical protein
MNSNKSGHPSVYYRILIPNLTEIRWVVSDVNHEVEYTLVSQLKTLNLY